MTEDGLYTNLGKSVPVKWGRTMKASYTVAAVCLGAALLCGCGQQAALEEQTTDAQGTAAETTEQVLYHGGEPRTPEEVLAQALADTGTQAPACPDCGEAMHAVLAAGEELPAKERACVSMAQGSDAVYDLSITYDWTCEACGACDAGHTIEGNRVIICHGWTS